MNAVNVGLVTFIIQHNRIQGVFLLCKITNLLIYSIHGKDAQNIQCRILKGHSDIFLGCSFAIPPFLIYKLIIR